LRFSHLGLVSLLCEWSWAIRLSAAPVVAPYWDPTTGLMQIRFGRWTLSQSGAPLALYFFLLLSGALINYIKPIEKYLALEPRTGTKSHIYSLAKLTSLRCENRKIRHENKI
jgi:hypothetical protein